MINSTDLITDLQGLLRYVHCPTCAAEQSLQLMLRCHSNAPGYMFIARCGSCNTEHAIDVEIRKESKERSAKELAALATSGN